MYNHELVYKLRCSVLLGNQLIINQLKTNYLLTNRHKKTITAFIQKWLFMV